jgi:hypothetical protein
MVLVLFPGSPTKDFETFRLEEQFDHLVRKETGASFFPKWLPRRQLVPG